MHIAAVAIATYFLFINFFILLNNHLLIITIIIKPIIYSQDTKKQHFLFLLNIIVSIVINLLKLIAKYTKIPACTVILFLI
ncbi:hypothetical protein SDC9_66529 [bioreactor metagenome]|uniref:Uncharacterized protein n=1 Tax=bioreactor metagenome TaxID=1076179 RepID=A0A644XV60_9ZZZZ